MLLGFRINVIGRFSLPANVQSRNSFHHQHAYQIVYVMVMVIRVQQYEFPQL